MRKKKHIQEKTVLPLILSPSTWVWRAAPSQSPSPGDLEAQVAAPSGGPTRGYPRARGTRRCGRGGHPAPLRRLVALRRRPGQGPRASPARRRAYGHVPAAGDSQAGLGRGPRHAAAAASGMATRRDPSRPDPRPRPARGQRAQAQSRRSSWCGGGVRPSEHRAPSRGFTEPASQPHVRVWPAEAVPAPPQAH